MKTSDIKKIVERKLAECGLDRVCVSPNIHWQK